jgi:hypothetical protein
MSTRGVLGWVIDGDFHAVYNHSDSYPEYLGMSIFEFVRSLVASGDRVEAILRENLKSLTSVEDGTKPTLVEQVHYNTRKFYNSGVSSGDINDWYCLLRNAQGTDFFPAVLSGDLRHFVESKDFIKDSSSCEWGWVLNFDTRSLEVYKGNWKKPGKYSTLLTEAEKNTAEDGYYPCERIRNIPFDEVRSEQWMLSACFKNGDLPCLIPRVLGRIELVKKPETKRKHTKKVVEVKPTEDLFVHRETLVLILYDAISEREKLEASWGYSLDSAYLGTLRAMLKTVKDGGEIRIKKG